MEHHISQQAFIRLFRLQPLYQHILEAMIGERGGVAFHALPLTDVDILLHIIVFIKGYAPAGQLALLDTFSVIE